MVEKTQEQRNDDYLMGAASPTPPTPPTVFSGDSLNVQVTNDGNGINSVRLTPKGHGNPVVLSGSTLAAYSAFGSVFGKS